MKLGLLSTCFKFLVCVKIFLIIVVGSERPTNYIYPPTFSSPVTLSFTCPLEMASGGPSSSPAPTLWAEIAASVKNHPANPSALVDGPVLRRIKASTSDFIRFDGDAVARAHLRFQHLLIG